ncbi:CsbD family protein [Aestuariimicrobium ganziense]|uniref:CsbD family protein n=1 Tax=Aestuariimicrobium ganziense TaxID=2773677 RepID=UPI001943A969|nr:CsbD family protein [Aestuariimicrobium ganziense]
MGVDDKLENTKDQAVGKIKQAAGDAKDDPGLEAEGQSQETKGDLKQAAEKVKDAFK